MGYHQYNAKNIIVGSVVPNLSTENSRPSSAYQVTYEYKDTISKAVTSDSLTLALLDRISGSGIAHTIDVEQVTPISGSVFTIWAIQTISGRSWFYSGDEGSSTYPTDWGTYDSISFKKSAGLVWDQGSWDSHNWQ
tara:strand:- start:239 stop:646 length:408 start_codon:yes stop_codon:yes gene_type:complete